jgi:hypothetical protein
MDVENGGVGTSRKVSSENVREYPAARTRTLTFVYELCQRFEESTLRDASNKPETLALTIPPPGFDHAFLALYYLDAGEWNFGID